MTWFLAVVALAMMLLNVGLLVKMLVTLDELRNFAVSNVMTQEAIQTAARVVAEDLAAQHQRADAVEGVPGEAADMAARSEPNIE